MTVLHLLCEYLPAPIGVGTRSPRFSWTVDTEKTLRQTGFRIEIFHTATKEKIFDSGFAETSAQMFRAENLPLEIQSRYEWTLSVRFSDGSVLQSRAEFETSFFSPDDWFDDWVTPVWVHIPPKDQSVTFLRGEFEAGEPERIIRARAYIGATTGIHGNATARMNMYRFRINGQPVCDDVLNPGQLSPRRGRALVRTFDILPFLREGKNAAGVIYISAKISIRILLEYSDGIIRRFSVRDGEWFKRPRGPFVRLWTNEIAEFDGKSEHYDARLEFTGWDLPGFADLDGWQPVRCVSAPDILAPQMQSAAPFLRKRNPALTRFPDGTAVADFGENRNGFVRIRTTGPAGTQIRLNYAEAVDADGRIDAMSTLSAQMEQSMHHDICWKRTDAPEFYEPSFALHGFRYVEISGMPEVSPDDLEAVYTMSSVNAGFQFQCADPHIQTLMEFCLRSCQSNLMSVPTDCCTRERLGWGADAASVSRFESAVFDLRLFYEKWFHDIADDQGSDGNLQVLAPFAIPVSCTALPWSRGFLAIAKDAWEQYGDRTFLAENYPMFRRFGKYLERITGPDGLSKGHCAFSDHYAKDQPDEVFLENAHVLNSFQLLAEFAGILGSSDDAEFWNVCAERRKSAINRHLRNGLSYGNATQSEAVHALSFRIVPESGRAALLEELCRQLGEDGFIRTGYTGTELLMRLLEEERKPELAMKLVRSSLPYTWSHWLELGLTTSPEAWLPEQESNRRTTLNHPALCGGLGAWLLRVFCGIRPLEPGYRKIQVRPMSGTDFSVTLPTPFGELCVHQKNGRTEIRNPFGTELLP